MTEEAWQELHEILKPYQERNIAATDEVARQDEILRAHMMLLCASRPETKERYDAMVAYTKALRTNAEALMELAQARRRTCDVTERELPKLTRFYDG